MRTIMIARNGAVLLLLGTMTIGGCGGGGGGSGGGITGGLSATTAINNDPDEAQEIAWFTLVNVLSLSVLGDSDLLGGVPLVATNAGVTASPNPDIALQNVMLWLSSQPLADRLSQPQSSGLQALAVLPSTTEPCDNPGGTTTVAGQIANLVPGVGLGAVVVGDYVDTDFSNCEIDGLRINGSIRISVDSFSFAAGNVPDFLDFLFEMELGPLEFEQMGYTLDFGQLEVIDGDAIIIYDGDFRVSKDWRNDPSLQVLELGLSATDLHLTIAGMRVQAPFPTYRLRQYSGTFEIDKRPIFTTYVAAGSGYLETSDFAGRVRFDILMPFAWEGEFGVSGSVWPTAGVMDIFGAADASIRATANPDNLAPYTDVNIEADVDADGMIIAPVPDLSLSTTWDMLSAL